MIREKQQSTDSTERFIPQVNEKNEEMIVESALRQKLEEILDTLQMEIQTNQKLFQRTKLELMGKIKEKDAVIECLVKINSNLVYENQQLKATNRKYIQSCRKKSTQMKENFEKERHQMISVIKYLESRNQNLLKKIHEQHLSSQSFLKDKHFSQNSFQDSKGYTWMSRCRQGVKIFQKTEPESTELSRTSSTNIFRSLSQAQRSSKETKTIKHYDRVLTKTAQKNDGKNRFNRNYKSTIFSNQKKITQQNFEL